MPAIDRTAISLLALAVGTGGVFAVLAKYSVPQLNSTFFGENPFAIKRDIIEGALTWVFLVIALVGVAIQAVGTIADLPERLYGPGVYGPVLLGSFVFVALLLKVATIGARAGARRRWLPRTVASSRESFDSASFAAVHGVLPEFEAVVAKDPTQRDELRARSIAVSLDRVAQIERLLEIESDGDLVERVNRLAPYFHSRARPRSL
jgi:hypothetical protein